MILIIITYYSNCEWILCERVFIRFITFLVIFGYFYFLVIKVGCFWWQGNIQLLVFLIPRLQKAFEFFALNPEGHSQFCAFCNIKILIVDCVFATNEQSIACPINYTEILFKNFNNFTKFQLNLTKFQIYFD